jgi:(4S)-4-hydroxy-5-phosphonooxypentane-2,3-dione isomerase
LPEVQEEIGMFIVHVDVHVKPEHVEGFRLASIRNAENSVREPGVARFDVVQSAEDLTRFVLVEVYRTDAAAGEHKQTAHYKEWRDTVAEMMAEPRQGRKYRAVFPDDAGWR